MTLTILDDLEQSRWTILRETRVGGSGTYVLARCSCGSEREVLRTRIATGKSRSCGCQRRKAPEARFWQFVSKSDPDQCWEWQSATNRRGYGKFWLNGRTDLAHRVSYRIANGPITDGLMVRHSCDNPPCVNPAHLLIGTGKDNARDALERDRYRRGTRNSRAKLTEQQVLAIREGWALGETQVAMARRFGVSNSAIQFVLSGKNWAHVEEAS